MASPDFAHANKVYESLKAEFNSSKPDMAKCATLLTQAKIALTRLSFLVIDLAHPPSKQDMLLAREILEIGALHALRVHDIPAFERYYEQLTAYYGDYAAVLPASPRHLMLRGLYLLGLLAQNRIAEFHAALELIPTADLDNIYIRHPVQLEQALMEGSYNKVWHSRGDVPAEECLFFLDMLMVTIRNEIASCAEKSFTSLPLKDVGVLLFFAKRDEVVQFCQQRGWTLELANEAVRFAPCEAIDHTFDTDMVLQNAVTYARELERIV